MSDQPSPARPDNSGAVSCDEASFTYRRASSPALQGVTLDWPGGSIALLGPNGAGKSTLVKLLVGELRASNGSVSVPSGSVGYLPQNAGWPAAFTVEELLTYSAGWHRVPRRFWAQHRERALGDVELTDLRHRRLGELSGGQRQRALIAQTLIHRPGLLILDEPTQGLDPHQRIAIRELLTRLDDETTVIVATHIVDDVEHMSDRVAVLLDGRLVYDDTTTDFLALGADQGSLGRSAMEGAYLRVTGATGRVER